MSEGVSAGAVGVALGVSVSVGVALLVAVDVAVAVEVSVSVGDGVGVFVSVGDGVWLDVGVGVAEIVGRTASVGILASAGGVVQAATVRISRANNDANAKALRNRISRQTAECNNLPF